MVSFQVPEQVLNNIVDYLLKRPYGEVYRLIGDLETQSKIIPESKPVVASEKQVLVEEKKE